MKYVRNFKVPLCTQQSQHKIDTADFRTTKKLHSVKIEKNYEYKTIYWFTYFDEKRIEENEKKFHFRIDTDGVTASILYENKNRVRNVKSADYIDTVAEKYFRGDRSYAIWLCDI